MGTTWTLRIGLVAIAIAGALFARTIVPALSPALKVVLAYAGALALFAVGWVFERRLEKFARPVMAGGLSLAFFVSFASHFIPAMRAVPLVPALAWMAAGVAAVLVMAARWGSQPTAGLAIFLGHVSAFVAAGDANGYSLVAIAFLSATAVVLLWRHDWLPLSLFAVVAAYASHLLWAITAQATVSPDRAALLNLIFLSSYYLIFLAADLLWWRRGDTDGEGIRRRTGRALGPTNVVLFVSLGSFLYAVAPGPPRPVEWFYWAVGVGQAGLTLVYRRLGNPERGFYTILATLLVTLGFFAALDALALNLVLAVEALVLLFAAHRTRMRVFHLLAQAALAVNFVHYWTFGVAETVTLPLFAGGLAVASVYLVKSQLEDLWYAMGRRDWEASDAVPESVRALAAAFDGVFARLAPFLPHLHAAAGALILLREFGGYLDPGPRVAALAAVLAALAAWTLVRRSPPMAVAYLVVQAGLVFAVQGAALGWAAGLGIAIVALAVPTGLATGAERRFDDPVRRLGVLAASLMAVWLGLAMSGLLLETMPADAGIGLYVGWVAVLALGCVHADRARAAWGDPRSRAPWQGVSNAFTCLLVSVVVVAATHRAIGETVAAPVWTSIWAAALFGAAAARRQEGFYLGGFALVLATHAYWLAGHWLGGPVAASSAASAVVIGVPLAVAFVQDRLAGARDELPLPRAWIDGATYLLYGLASFFFLLVLHERVAFPWTAAAVAVLPLGLYPAATRLSAPRGTVVAVIVLLLAAWEYLAEMLATAAVVGGLAAGLVLAVATVVFERLVFHHRRQPDGTLSTSYLQLTIALIVTAAVVAMVAVSQSAWPSARWASVGWSIVAAALMLLGFGWRTAPYRRVALGLFAISLARVFLVDIRGLSADVQTLAFLILGVLLVAVAWLYARFSGQLRKWL